MAFHKNVHGCLVWMIMAEKFLTDLAYFHLLSPVVGILPNVAIPQIYH